jgi:isopropylmalate/homocitrate/citramalate synthase
MSRMVYPICNSGLIQILTKNDKLYNVFNKLNKIKLFDVSLRDGLQSIKGDTNIYTTEYKHNLYKEIIKKYNPMCIEVGSIVSSKILPILSDSLDLFELCESEKISNNNSNYLLVPSSNKLKYVMNAQCFNISLITSVSEEFQLKNTKKNLYETRNDITETIYNFSSEMTIKNPKVKIYLSCIDTCPIKGKIPLNKILDEIRYYDIACKPDNLCLSDTTGTLEPVILKEILDGCLKMGISNKKLSLHLHINPKSIEKVIKNIDIALERNITGFDVSILDTGGCSVTMGNLTNANLSYELFYKALIDYLEKRIV